MKLLVQWAERLIAAVSSGFLDLPIVDDVRDGQERVRHMLAEAFRSGSDVPFEALRSESGLGREEVAAVLVGEVDSGRMIGLAWGPDGVFVRQERAVPRIVAAAAA